MNRARGFDRYELHPRVLERLPSLGFRRATEVQHQVIPLFTQKKNLIVEAPTGTGKTAAYGLPLISRLDFRKRSTQALVLVPSRELALQVSKALQSYFDGDQLKVGAVYGGVGLAESFQAMKASPHILVAIPARIRDVMAHYEWDFLWRDIKFLVVDEGDKLLESGFQRDFDYIRENISGRVQVGFFSATISRDAESMMRERFKALRTVRLSPKQMMRNIRFSYTRVRGKREAFLIGLLTAQEINKALIFCGRREDLYGITGLLRNCGYKAEAYYGNQEQQERLNILRRFQEGHIDYLVATDLAARGLDIDALPAVINLAIPEIFDYYLHRVGRTGRAGNKGKVFNLVASDKERFWLTNHHQFIDLPVKRLPIEAADMSQVKTTEDEKWIKYLLSRGKRDKIRKGDIVGFLIHNAELTTDDIGTITIYDSYSTVDLPQRAYTLLSSREDPLKLKGKSLKIRKYQIEDQEKKAKAVRQLKQDRKKM
ncbi:MAG: DEAD/DEAH box helicase [Bacteroidota bacterium]